MKKRWNAGNAKDQADYERRLMLAYDILLSYPAVNGRRLESRCLLAMGIDARCAKHSGQHKYTI